jgi:hypothetical protein
MRLIAARYDDAIESPMEFSASEWKTAYDLDPENNLGIHTTPEAILHSTWQLWKYTVGVLTSLSVLLATGELSYLPRPELFENVDWMGPLSKQ